MQLYHILGLENVFSVFVREPEDGNYGKGGPDAGTVRARLPAKPKNSVFVREPKAGNYGKGGPGAGTVRARLSAKPKNSVFVREPEDGNYGKGGRLPGRAHSGPCSGICTRKKLAFLYTNMHYHTNAIKNILKKWIHSNFYL